MKEAVNRRELESNNLVRIWKLKQ